MYVPKTSVWARLDEDSRKHLVDGAVREVARRSYAGAMVYFATLAAVPFASSCLRDHPTLTIAALCCTFAGGAMRCIAAAMLLRRTAAVSNTWNAVMAASTIATVTSWGAYCGFTLYTYPNTWPSTYLMIAGAALGGGLTTSMAPQLRLGTVALLLTVLPTGLCAVLLGGSGSTILGISACAYLTFLLVQLRHNCKAYWAIATASALDAMLSWQAATQSESRFQTLFEDAPGGIYLAFPNGQVEMANRALAQMLGYTGPEAIAGRELREFSKDDDRAEMRGQIEEDGHLAGWESEWRRADGTKIRVRESVRAVQAGADGQGRLLGIVEDVTAHFMADQARRQLIEILESTSDFVESIAVGGETLYMNRASRALQGEDGGGMHSVWNGSGDDELRKARLRFADREGIWQGESWLPAANGKPIPVSQVIISHRLSGGATQSYSIVSRDISAMREAQAALKETEEQLFQAQRLESLGRLAGGIAHDFNNLLTIIIGHTSMLEMQMKTPDERSGLEEIGKASARAADLTRQLLAFGRKQLLSKGVVDVKEIAGRAERLLRRLIGERILLVTRMSAELQNVMADAAQLEQVLVNLLLNARDAMPYGGVATIETSVVQRESEPGKDFVRIAVTDTGIGMDEETMARVFEPFFTTKGRGRGTGLGLATAYGFIQQSGGSISVSSKPNAGTTFTILLPRCEGTAVRIPQELHISDPGGNEHILVVDDEPALRGLMRQTLAGRGYIVVEARDGEHALSLARESQEAFDLLVTDVIMPGISGQQLATRLHAMTPGIGVLFVSGYPGETEAERAVFGGDAAYLAKPFTAEALLRQVRQQLEKRRAEATGGAA